MFRWPGNAVEVYFNITQYAKITLQLWDVRTGHCIATLRGHEDEVFDIGFNCTGQQIVSASADGTFVAVKKLGYA